MAVLRTAVHGIGTHLGRVHKPSGHVGAGEQARHRRQHHAQHLQRRDGSAAAQEGVEQQAAAQTAQTAQTTTNKARTSTRIHAQSQAETHVEEIDVDAVLLVVVPERSIDLLQGEQQGRLQEFTRNTHAAGGSLYCKLLTCPRGTRSTLGGRRCACRGSSPLAGPVPPM